MTSNNSEITMESEAVDTADTRADIDSFVEEIPAAITDGEVVLETDSETGAVVAIAKDSPDERKKHIKLIAGENAIGGDLLQQIVEGALLSAGKPLTIIDLAALFEDHERPAPDSLREALSVIGERCNGRGFELREVASGYRFQVIQDVAPWIARMWEERPQRYSRALLETLSLIAYRQPITRGDIEDIRGVAVASNIMKTLLEREWVRIVGHKDVPGRPAMFATTRKFLDYFNLKNLEDLPALSEIRDLDSMNAELSLEGADTPLMDTLGQSDPAENDDAETDNADTTAIEAAAAETVSETTAAETTDEYAPVQALPDHDADIMVGEEPKTE
jgi:segregation and condensation protein B